jgi:hypothetical protein
MKLRRIARFVYMVCMGSQKERRLCLFFFPLIYCLKLNLAKSSYLRSPIGSHGEPKRKKALFVVFLSYFIYRSQIWLNRPTYDHHFGYAPKSTPNNLKKTHIHQCPLCTDDLIWTQEMPISQPYPIFLWILQEVPNKPNWPD